MSPTFVIQKLSFLTASPALARNEFKRIEKVFCFDNWTWIISKYLQFVIYTNLKSFNLKTFRWRNEIIFWKLQQILQIRKMKYSYWERSKLIQIIKIDCYSTWLPIVWLICPSKSDDVKKCSQKAWILKLRSLEKNDPEFGGSWLEPCFNVLKKFMLVASVWLALGH